jgi:hypothetical protein
VVRRKKAKAAASPRVSTPPLALPQSDAAPIPPLPASTPTQ